MMFILLLVFPPQADFGRQTVNPFALGSFRIKGEIVPALLSSAIMSPGSQIYTS